MRKSECIFLQYIQDFTRYTKPTLTALLSGIRGLYDQIKVICNIKIGLKRNDATDSESGKAKYASRF